LFGNKHTVDLISALNAFRNLIHLQGRAIPYCYGLHLAAMEGAIEDVKAIVLEKLSGVPLSNTLKGSMDDGKFLGFIEGLFRIYWSVLQDFHKSGYVHCDLSGEYLHWPGHGLHEP
jgi:hypothetical protein